MSSCTRKPAQLSTLLCFPQLAARPGLPGIPWAAPATAPTVPEHGAERGWNGNRQLMGTQRLVKTFSSGDAVVWRFLSGAQPSQRPVVLCLLFSTMSMSIFQFALPLCLFSFHFCCPVLVMSSCPVYSNSGIAFPLFIYSGILLAYLQGAFHTHHSYQEQPECNHYHYYNSSIDVILFFCLPGPVLTPLFFLHAFHTAHFSGQTPELNCLRFYVCEALSSEWSLQLHAQQQCLVMGTGWAPSLTSSPDI